ncbi:hypothetical protein BDN70DRAFT_939194 [Pholiota conissans]|uniref:Uncharacterized protein n=1 Tax=Pholiota conissans TaxID=109636 RepID=A0A9P5YLI7_9AGAR|nr:hypothetical protein BDN70DRAFT_939194 [Pholiota conissans]
MSYPSHALRSLTAVEFSLRRHRGLHWRSPSVGSGGSVTLPPQPISLLRFDRAAQTYGAPAAEYIRWLLFVDASDNENNADAHHICLWFISACLAYTVFLALVIPEAIMVISGGSSVHSRPVGGLDNDAMDVDPLPTDNVAVDMDMDKDDTLIPEAAANPGRVVPVRKTHKTRTYPGPLRVIVHGYMKYLFHNLLDNVLYFIFHGYYEY